jgi:hypothetical protein
MTDGKKVMFEIFREREDGAYRVVYFTELTEHEKDDALSEAMHGSHVYSGYFLHRDRERAKAAVARLLVRLNAGEAVSEQEIEYALDGVCV